MSFWSVVIAILKKDITIELRSWEILSSTTLFALLTVLLSAFAFGLNVLPAASASAGVLYLSVSFSGILVVSRTYLRERDNGVYKALLLTSAPRAAIFLGKMLGVATFLIALIFILIPIIELFFHAPMLKNFPMLALIALLSVSGYSSAATLFGAMTIKTQLKDIILGAVLFPLVAPILIAAVKASEAVLIGDAVRDFIELLVVIDIIYILGGIWLFGPLMEE